MVSVHCANPVGMTNCGLFAEGHPMFSMYTVGTEVLVTERPTM